MILEFEIKNINNDQAVLVNNNQEQLTLNITNLPANSKPGDKIMLAVASAQSGDDKNPLAKDILNELLNTES